MFDKIIILVVTPVSHRDYNRFGIELLKDRFTDLEIWDISSIVFPWVDRSNIEIEKKALPYYKIFNSKKLLKKELNLLNKRTCIISYLALNYMTISIYRLVSESEAPYCFPIPNAYPFPEKVWSIEDTLYKLKRFFKEVPLEKIKHLLFTKIPINWLKIKPVRFIILGGEESIKRIPVPIDKDAKFIWAHAFDYDLYLNSKNKCIKEENVAVFLDDAMPCHPDPQYTKRDCTIKASDYYFVLNTFFDKVEKEQGCRVVIASHPRVHYKNSDCFNGRPIFNNCTIDIVKKSRIVLAHDSYSTNFANIYYKPVIFLTSVKLNQSRHGYIIRNIAQCFGKKPVFMDGESKIDWEAELSVDKEVYKEYFCKYIKTKKSPDIPMWEIVTDSFIKKGV